MTAFWRIPALAAAQRMRARTSGVGQLQVLDIR